MLKIYSRPRIKIPIIRNSNFNIGGRNNRNRNVKKSKLTKLIQFLIIMFIMYLLLVLLVNTMLPIFNRICENKAKSIATIVTNDETTKVVEKYPYDELFNIEKDNNGKIVMINSNMVAINKEISDIAANIQRSLNDIGRDDVEIALGSFTGMKLLSGRGPNVKIRVSTVGDVDTDLRSEFIQQGINQTLHRVYLQIDCFVDILTPFEKIESQISNQFLLAENVIIGEIPETFYQLEGIDTKEDMLKIME